MCGSDHNSLKLGVWSRICLLQLWNWNFWTRDQCLLKISPGNCPEISSFNWWCPASTCMGKPLDRAALHLQICPQLCSPPWSRLKSPNIHWRFVRFVFPSGWTIITLTFGPAPSSGSALSSTIINTEALGGHQDFFVLPQNSNWSIHKLHTLRDLDPEQSTDRIYPKPSANHVLAAVWQSI